MEQKDPKKQEKVLSELMEFDFDDILMDDISEEAQFSQRDEKRAAAPKAAPDKPSPEAMEKKTKQEKKARRKKGFRIGIGIATWVKDLAIAAVVFWFLITFIASTFTMPDQSMDPTMASGEHLLISKIVYRFTEPDRGDVVAFQFENAAGQKQEAISRVIGVPGDTIMLEEQGNITVNGKALRTSYCNGKTKYVPNQLSYPYTVPEGFYFVLSDNPNGTTDSRFTQIGAIASSDIIGRAILCYWPQESWRPIG